MSAYELAAQSVSSGGFALSIVSQGKLRLARAINAAAPAVWDWDIATGQFLASDRLRELYGFAADPPLDFESFYQATDPRDLGWKASLIEASSDIRYRIRRADTGELRWMRAHVMVDLSPDGSGRHAGYTGTVEDITAEVEADHALMESEGRLRLAVEAGKMAVWEVDLESGTITNTPELNLLFGFPADAKPTFQDFRARYAPGELGRLAREGATLEVVRSRLASGELTARKEGADGSDRTQVQAEVSIVLPGGQVKHLLYRAQYAFDADSRPRITGFLVDITERKLAEERLSIVARELRHRVKNSLAVVQAIASQSFRIPSETATGMESFLGRLHALSLATDLVLDGDAEDTELAVIVGSITRPYRTAEADPFTIEGAAARLGGKAVNAISMILHELCTNAVKYGALSSPGGGVELRWHIVEDRKLAIDWIERGGPKAVAPARQGFGTRLLAMLATGELAGSIQLQFEPAGLRCHIVTGPLLELARSSASRLQPV